MKKDRDKNTFAWKTKDGEIKVSHSITDILKSCGFDYEQKKHRKFANFVYINLVSPRIDYKTGGKFKIELKPFSSIAQDMYKFCKSSKTGRKAGWEGSSYTSELTDLLRDRLHDVKENPDLLVTDRWTQSTVWYHLRPILQDKGMDTADKRDYVTGLIRKVCNYIFGKKRHELGIIAAERAQLYFKGQSLGVGFDQLEELMKKGTDLLVIEKEGIADALIPFADKHGMAILNSRGFLTEYASDLSKLAEENGCNIAVLTDLDSSGLSISTKIPNGHRIGIDFKMLERLNVKKGDVEEDVIIKKKTESESNNESDNHLKNLLKKPREYNIPPPYTAVEWEKLIDFLNTSKRIEIDSVQAVVGNQRLWNYIIGVIQDKFPNRDYNRAIDVPDHVLLKPIEEFIEKIKNIFIDDQSEERDIIIEELSNTMGIFSDVDVKKQEIEERLRSVSDTDEVKKKISDILKEFKF